MSKDNDTSRLEQKWTSSRNYRYLFIDAAMQLL